MATTTVNPILKTRTIGFDRVTKKAAFGNDTDHWNDLPKVGMEEAPLDGGAYLAQGREWKKINEAESWVEVEKLGYCASSGTNDKWAAYCGSTAGFEAGNGDRWATMNPTVEV